VRVKCFDLLFELWVTEVKIQRTDVLIPEHTAQDVTLGEKILNRHDASLLRDAAEMTDQNEGSAVLDLKHRA